MLTRSYIPSFGSILVFCSVACMGATLALAQRAVDPQRGASPPRVEAPRVETQPVAPQQPAERRGEEPLRERGADVGSEPAESPRRQVRQLGIQFEGQDDLVVGEVAPGSTAADAGLRPRDRILSVDGRQITGQRRFAAFLSSLTGRRVPVVIEREGRQYTIQLMPGEASENGPWLGVFLQDSEENKAGAQITHVYPAGPAARAGLRPGDVILKVNDQEVQSAPDLIATIDGMKPQSKVALRIMRGDRELDAAATLASRDAYVFHQARYGDDRGRGDDRFDEDDAFGQIPPHAMQLEHDRRMAEQHERIETELRKLQEEVRLLREALQRK